MNKLTTSLLVVASLNFCAQAMEQQQQVQTITLMTETPKLSKNQKNKFEKKSPQELGTSFMNLSDQLAKAHKNAVDVAKDPRRSQRAEIWNLLKIKVGKDKAREYAYGYADDFSDEEKDFEQIDKDDYSWKRFYENSKRKTDTVISGIGTKKEVAETSIIAAQQREKVIEEKTRNVKEQNDAAIKILNAKIEELELLSKKHEDVAEKELEEIAHEVGVLQSSVEKYTKAIVHHTNTKKQNEAVLMKVKEERTKELEELDKTIEQFNGELEALLLNNQQSNYAKIKTDLEGSKQKAVQRKKDLHAELDDINYRLPKINEPGSKTRYLTGWFYSTK